MKSATIFDSEQSWGAPINFLRKGQSLHVTGWTEELTILAPAAREILTEPYWAAKIDRGLADSAQGRRRPLRDHLANA